MASELKIALPDEAEIQITAMFLNSARKAFDELVKQQSYPPYLKQKEAADYLGISVSSFKKLAIPRVCLEGIERYSRKTLDEYAKQNEI